MEFAVHDLQVGNEISSNNKILIVELPKCEFIANDVREYFKKFGEIKTVNIQKSPNLLYNSCKIEYEDAEGAEAALKKSCHYITHRNVPLKIFVKAINAIALTDLNEYCLADIFKSNDFLGQIRLSQCNQLLEKVYVDYICPKKKSHVSTQIFSKMVSFSEKDIDQFWRLYGSHCKSIFWKGPKIQNPVEEDATLGHCDVPSAMHLAIYKYSSNLNELVLWRRPCNEYTYFFNASNKKSIRILELAACDILDSDLVQFISMPNLKSLDLSHNKRISGEPIIRMTQLQSLIIKGCDNVQIETLVEICKALSLHGLDVCSQNFTNLNIFVEHCKELKELKCMLDLDAELTSYDIIKLPYLYLLSIYDYCDISEDFFELLAEHKSHLKELGLCGSDAANTPMPKGIRHFKQLRKLYLESYSLDPLFFEENSCYNLSEIKEMFLYTDEQITDSQVLSLIQKCGKLQQLNVSGNSWKLTKNVGERIISILRRRAETSATYKTPFELTIYYYQDIMDRVYLNAPKLIKVFYGTMDGKIGHLSRPTI